MFTSGFVDDVMSARNRPGKKAMPIGPMLKVTHRGAEPRAKCDVYDGLVVDCDVR